VSLAPKQYALNSLPARSAAIARCVPSIKKASKDGCPFTTVALKPQPSDWSHRNFFFPLYTED
jgi:hypothetical protein